MQEYQVKVYTSKETPFPRTEWRQNGKYHRLDGPAIEWTNGDNEWFQNGQRHRKDGPAIEWADGYKSWCIEGKLHRTDGPAIEYANGDKTWCIEGECYTEEEFKQKIKKITPSCTTKTVIIDGVEYQLVKC